MSNTNKASRRAASKGATMEDPNTTDANQVQQETGTGDTGAALNPRFSMLDNDTAINEAAVHPEWDAPGSEAPILPAHVFEGTREPMPAPLMTLEQAEAMIRARDAHLVAGRGPVSPDVNAAFVQHPGGAIPAGIAAARAMQAPRHVDDPGFLYVLDRSATARSGPRTHEIYDEQGYLIPFTFEPYKGLKLPELIAFKFLKHEGFVRSTPDGQELDFAKPPKRPEELGAGEKLVIEDDQTIARYEELTDDALRMRCAMLPGGEVAVRSGNRRVVIAHIVNHFKAVKAANTVVERDPDGFTPEPETGDF